MQLNQTFNTETLPQSEKNFDPIPAGWYTASITDAGVQDTKSGTGQYIKVRFDVTGPQHEGRVVFTNLNIRNQNSTAERIGQEQLGELMRATGIATLSDTDQLVGGQCKIKVTIRKSEEYGDSNEIKAFKAMEGGAPPVPAKPAAEPAAASPPWLKK